jgi:DNA-binding beta-propeller fold protein YncE
MTLILPMIGGGYIPAGGGGGGWTDPDIDNASYDGVSLAISGQNFADAFFKPDGTVLFAADGDGISAYNLSTAWDLTTSSSGSSFAWSFAFCVYFKPDGGRVFWLQNSNDTLYQVDLSTPWDLSTAGTAVAGAPVVGSIVRGLRFNSDGTKVYACDRANTQVEQFNLSTAWDISASSASTTPSEIFDTSSQSSEPSVYAFNPDGTKMWLTDTSSDSIYEYNLSTADDISTASYANKSFDLSSQDSVPIGGQFKSDGSKMYIAGLLNDTLFQYSTN